MSAGFSSIRREIFSTHTKSNYFLSPNVNGGIAKVIADSSNVPFYPSLNPGNVFPPLCRPVIGRTEFNEYLFVAFSGSTENIYVGFDSVTYFAGYITYSNDGGETWGGPDKFTPDTPLLDWKYISTPPVYDVIQVSPPMFTIHYVLQADTLKESPNPQFLSAQYYHASFTNNPPSVGDEGDLNKYLLEQNYPNPFNPVTTIKYSIPTSSFVQLKVYDVLGNEIATLVNEEKTAGRYETEFFGTDLPSSVYFYKLTSGEFAQTKKMILLK